MADFLDETPHGFRDIVERMREALSRTGVVTDFAPGSVARTLVETFAREVATCYSSMERAHDAGYLDSAGGKALDNVVALLGISRAKPGRLVGMVELRRLTPAPRDIYIPAGYRLTGPLRGDSPVPVLETVEEVKITRGERRVLAAVQELEGAELEQWNTIPPGTLTIMTKPILGVEGVTNPDPIVRGGEEESDEHLRARAREALREAQKGTAESIEAAIRERGIQQVVVEEPAEGPAGRVVVRISDPGLEENPALRRAVARAIRSSKAAGVQVETKYLRTVYFQPVVFVEPMEAAMDELAFGRLADELRKAVADFISAHSAGEPLPIRKLEAVFYNNAAVREINLDEGATRSYLQGDEGIVEDFLQRRMASRDWFLSAMESSDVDMKRWPPIIERLISKEARIDAIVMKGATELDGEMIKQTVTAVIEKYVAGVQPDEESKLREIEGAGILAAITGKAPVEAILEMSLTHLHNGQVELLKEVGKEFNSGYLEPTETLAVRTLQLRGGGGS